MNSRRLKRLLQAVSYDIPAYGAGQKMYARQISENRISMQEAIALYMQTITPFVTPPVEQSGEERQNLVEVDSGKENSPHMVIVEAGQFENRRRRNAKECIESQNYKKKSMGRAGATAQSLPTDVQQQQENALERLDANRIEGHLLYSYDNTGAHSILGKDIRPGGYGGNITLGNYADKA